MCRTCVWTLEHVRVQHRYVACGEVTVLYSLCLFESEFYFVWALREVEIFALIKLNKWD